MNRRGLKIFLARKILTKLLCTRNVDCATRLKKGTFVLGRLNFPPSGGAARECASAVLSNYSKLLRRVRALKGLN